MEGLCRLFPTMMEACKWVCLVATDYSIPDEERCVWFPVCTVLVYELVFQFLFGWPHCPRSEYPCMSLVWLPPAIAE